MIDVTQLARVCLNVWKQQGYLCCLEKKKKKALWKWSGVNTPLPRIAHCLVATNLLPCTRTWSRNAICYQVKCNCSTSAKMEQFADIDESAPVALTSALRAVKPMLFFSFFPSYIYSSRRLRPKTVFPPVFPASIALWRSLQFFLKGIITLSSELGYNLGWGCKKPFKPGCSY